MPDTKRDEASKAKRGALSNRDETPTASVGLASGLQPSGTTPGGSPEPEPAA